MSDIWQDPSTKAWINHVLDEMVPKMKGSAMVMQLIPDNREGDVKFWVELGAAVMLDKPILGIAFNDADIPDKLRLVSDEIIVLEEGVTPENSERVAQAVRRMMDRI